MTANRQLYLDRCIGESRGVVTLDGKPERLLIERDGDARRSQAHGARFVARVSRIERGLATAFLEMPDGPDAVASLSPGLVAGAAMEVEVAAEPRAGKSAVVRVLGRSEGPPRQLAGPAPLEKRLARYADGAIVEGPDARAMADAAQHAALAVEHRLPGGGAISIETTRALTSIDVDQGERGGADARRTARQTNLAAIAAGARLLRLKGLGGLVVFDLVGKGHDGAAMSEAARTAFAPDGPQVSIGPISRFGLFELSLPRGTRPAIDILTDGGAGPSVETLALDMIRTVEREWRANPGARVTISAPAPLLDAARGHLTAMSERYGVICSLSTAEGRPDTFEVSAR